MKNVILFFTFLSLSISVVAQNIPLPQYKTNKDRIFNNSIYKSKIKNKEDSAFFIGQVNQIFDSVNRESDIVKNSLFKNPEFYINFFNNLKSKPSNKYTNYNYEELTNELMSLRNQREKDVLSQDEIKNINESVRLIKNEITFNRFLTREREAYSFWIFEINKYNIDSINYYLLGQGKVASFQNITVQNFDESTTVNAELGSFFFGPVRLGVSGSFNSKSDSADKAISKSIQQIFNNGGALGLNFSLPLLLTRDTADNIHFGVYAQSSFGLNPGFGPDSKRMDFSNNILFNNQTGLNFHFDVGSSDKKARLFFDVPILYSWASQNTYQQLNITDYSVVKLQIGASLGDLVSFKISGPLYSSTSTIQNLPFTMSLNFSPFNL